jgi:hypothetical protein
VCKLAVGFLFVTLVSAEVRTICLDDRAGLNSFSRKAFSLELSRLLGAEQFVLAMAPCAVPAVSLVIAAHPPARYAQALGLAKRSGERVFPQLEIYTQPVLRIVGVQTGAATLGRALARVAGHELGHYLRQQVHHDDDGLMQVAFGTAYLASHKH